MTVRFLVVLVPLLLAGALGCVRESTPPTATQPAPSGQQGSPTTVPASTPTPQSRVIAVGLLLELQSPPEEEVVVMQPTVEVRGKTVLDAVVTINGEVVPVDASGEFSANVELESGPNTITVVANDFQGNEQARVLTVIYVP